MLIADDDRRQPVFEALIVPHRSLTPRGVTVVVALLSVLLALVTLRFWLIGAWPVVAFSLAEVPLAVLLLAINIRSARASELILLDAQELTVVRTNPKGGRLRFSLPVAWLRVDHERAAGLSRIMLSCHGESREVGAFLHEAQKQSLCEAMNTALHGLRHPSFDNPQLR